MAWGIIIGLVLGWLIGGAIVLAVALRSDLSVKPVAWSDVPFLIGGMLLWPMLLFPEEAKDSRGGAGDQDG